MIANVPILNPIGFYKNQNIDWSTNWPNMDNVTARNRNIEGIVETLFYNDWVIGKTMSIQLRVVTEGNENLSLYKMNDFTGVYALHSTIVPVNITPVGWVSEKINKYDYTFTETGVYYFYSSTAGILSNKFVVHSNLKFKKRLVQIEYYNTENDYGIVFFDNGVQRYSGLTYFTGQLKLGSPGNNISALDTNRGEVVKLRSTPTRTAILNIVDIHYADIDRINHIFSCDNITVNGVTYQNKDIGEAEQESKTDLYKMSIRLTQTNYNYYKV